MTFIQSLGQVASVPGVAWYAGINYGALRLYDRYAYDYATLYKTQPNIRTCVDFLARNIAQLGLHVFQRVGETDRKRLRDHPLAQLIEKPLPPEYKVTRYRLIESLVSDLGVYFNGFWLKAKGGEYGGLLRVPPPWMVVYGNLAPLRYELRVPGMEPRVLQPPEVVHFRGYNPEDAVQGLSPLETLRRVLAEEHAMGDYRENYWRNSARMAGVIERPKDAPDWSDGARARFKAEFEALYSGGQNSGKTAILEEGMTWRAGTFDAQQSEYLGGRKLTREECARAYHIPLPMVGILDNATFSNIREQHKNLYQDCLGPWLSMLEGDIETQLLTDFPEPAGVYVEFNIQEKLQGSFEEQTESLNKAVGRPWMLVNEARARMNLPGLPDGDELALPLNVTVGTAPVAEAEEEEEGEGTRIARMNTDRMRRGWVVMPNTGGLFIEATRGMGATAKDLRDRSTAWIGMYVPADVAEKLALVDGEAADALHMTLVYLGTLPQAERDRLPGVIETWAKTASPIRASISGLGRFQGIAGDDDAVVALVDAPGLPEWRQSLVDYLKSSGFKPDVTHGFTPHITLAYMSADEDAPDGVADLEFVFDKLTLSFGDVRRDYVLSGKPKSRLTALLRTKKAARKGRKLDPTYPELRGRYVEKWGQVMGGYFDRQERALLPRVPESGGTIASVWSDGARWDRELTQDMFKMSMATAMAWAQQVGSALDAEVTEDEIAAWVTANATAAAKNINKATRDELAEALKEDEEEPESTARERVKGLFAVYIAARAGEIATSRVTSLAAFGSHEGARKGGLKTKTWQVNSANPRDEHAAMDGETVEIDEVFSNGMLWPGDSAGGADNNAGCQCSVSFERD